MSFDQLGLAPELIRVVADQGYTEPTPVQEQAIPLVLAGRDVLAAAQTGTGKTAAFVLPILQMLTAGRPVPETPPMAPPAHLYRDKRHNHGRVDPRNATRSPIRVLVLTPTRELALQVEESVRTYGARHPIRSTTIYGGVGYDPQVRNLRAGPEIVVATPGRLLDHVEQRTIDLGLVEILVLDEADRMLDMGFIQPIRKIISLLPAKRQNLLFSATFNDDIRRLAGGILVDPVSIQVSTRNTAPELVEQLIYRVDRERKRELLSHLVRTGKIDQALVFTRTKYGANRLAEQLERDGIAATAIHGNKSQGQRVRALDDFKAGRATVLVATDIAARGIDIESLPHVVNFELPMVPEDYIHRIGRTGRAGIDGAAISLVCVDENSLLRDIEGLLRHKIPSEVVEGFEPDRNIRAESIRLRSAPGARPMGGGRPGGNRPMGGGRPMGGNRPMGGARPSQGRRPAPAAGPMAYDRPMAQDRPMAPARPINSARPSYGDRPLGGDRSIHGKRPNGPARHGKDQRPAGVGFGNVARPPQRGGPDPDRGFRPTGGGGHGPRPNTNGPRSHNGGGHGQRPSRPFAMPGERIAGGPDRRPEQSPRD
jgi:ATP-dependent RNA helicase RhlE